MRTLLLGAGTGIGLWLILVVLLPPKPTLVDSLTAVFSPPPASPASEAESGWMVRLGEPMTGFLADLGLPGTSVRRNLLVLDRPIERHLAEKAAAAIIGLLVPPLFVGLMAVGGVIVPVAIPLWGGLLLAIGGFITPDLALRSQVEERRTQLRHALSSFLDLVVIALAGGAGVESSMDDASTVGTGWAFQQLRHALTRARTARVPPWQSLGRLGEEFDVPELVELAASVSLAGSEGARVRASLAAKAQSLRSRELSDAEGAAQSATEQMSLPVVLLFGGFFAFIVFPAIVHIGTAL